ncbi:hypothetical protein Y032_0149g2728 [Ancylostoma ceylanicum]|uniref:Uncharacterized protein n=1 Tax=Ancylostoma ceylanicum TaxID=53326 RepID=A0A016T1Q8_9BILA|nr:hypothetical protein Y032_0149g2728 [Ancylostoma ceylanicum]
MCDQGKTVFTMLPPWAVKSTANRLTVSKEYHAWREDSDPTHRRPARVVHPLILQAEYISACLPLAKSDFQCS